MVRLALNLWSLGLATTGGFLLWAAINDPDGGLVGAVRELAAGQSPTPGVQKHSELDDLLTRIRQAAADAGMQATGAAGGMGGGGRGATVVAEAKKYLGSPYRWGGASKSGIDCSGLSMMAYRAVGISLPHNVTAQTRKGHIVPRNQVQPGDLVAYGTPARYPHCAIALNATEMIHAPTWGQPVQYGKIDMRVSGGPTIFRLL